MSMSTTLAVGLIAALTALITAGLSVSVQLIANAHARKTAAEDRAAALEAERERREYEARERRYEVRREALIAFNLACVALSRQIDEKTPGDPDLLWAVDDTLVRVRLVCPASVGDAADRLAIAVLTLGHPRPVFEVERDFRKACHGVIGEGDPRFPRLPTTT